MGQGAGWGLVPWLENAPGDPVLGGGVPSCPWWGGPWGEHGDAFPWGAWPQEAAADTHKQAGRQSTALTRASSCSYHVTKRFRIL